MKNSISNVGNFGILNETRHITRRQNCENLNNFMEYKLKQEVSECLDYKLGSI